MTDDGADLPGPAGLPPAAVDRVRHQRASGVRGSLLSAPAAAAIRSAGLEPVGEVFGCIVVTFGWSGGPCGYGYTWNTTFPRGGPVGGGPVGPAGGWGSRIPGTVGGGIAGGTSGNRGGGIYGYGPVTPVVVSGDAGASRFSWGRTRAQAVEHALGEAHRRMLAEARALGADGVLGITRSMTGLDVRVEEYASLGTAVRYSDPALARHGAAPWAAALSGEDVAAAAAAGFRPAGVGFGYSMALKHEDWQLRQQRSTWTNQEVDGLTELLGAARADARRSLDRQARAAAQAQGDGSGEVVVSESAVRTFERICTGEQKDLMAEALFVGTVLTPHPSGASRGRTLTVLPLTPPTRAARRRR